MTARLPPEDLHGDWLIDKVLPQLFEQAKHTNVDVHEVVMFVFANLGTILQVEGFTAEQLDSVVRANALTTHQIPESLQ